MLNSRNFETVANLKESYLHILFQIISWTTSLNIASELKTILHKEHSHIFVCLKLRSM
jgi:hypothetical protein